MKTKWHSPYEGFHGGTCKYMISISPVIQHLDYSSVLAGVTGRGRKVISTTFLASFSVVPW